MSTSKTPHPFDDVSLSAQPRLETLEASHASVAVPNFTHVGENPYALEAYLRLYVREWTERVRNDSTH